MKVVVILILLALVLLLAYACTQGLPGDVLDPWQPPARRD